VPNEELIIVDDTLDRFGDRPEDHFTQAEIDAFAQQTESRIDEGGSNVSFSTTVSVTYNGPAVPGPLTPVESTERSWEISVKQHTAPVNGRIYAFITYGVGEQLFARKITLTGITQIRVPVSARSIQISLQWIDTAAPPQPLPGAVIVDVGVADGARNINPQEWFAPVWNEGTTANADNGQLDVGAGTILLLVFSILAMPTAPGNGKFCVMLFDKATAGAPTTGTAPILASPPCFGQGSAQWADEGAPAVRYALGLVWALSSTFDTFTPCGVGGQVRADFKKGN